MRWRVWTRRLVRASLVLAVLLAAFVGWLYFFCVATPPPLDGRPAILDLAMREDPDGTRRIGPHWFRPRPGRSLLYVEGDAFDMGYANATLTADRLAAQEQSLLDTVERALPSRLVRLLVGVAVIINNRNLPDYVAPALQREILGLSMGGEDPFPHLGPRYHRILNYHAAHDIAHWVADQPIVGCTAFAAREGATRDGGLLVGRTFDFEAGAHFDEHKIIGLYRPTEGRAFLSVSWPGMAGAVTGLNDARIYVSLNAAKSQDRSNIGEPVSLLVRRVLQHAGTLEEAIALIEAAKVFVSDSYLVACGRTGRAAIVERSPKQSAVRTMDGTLLLQSNHFEAERFADDAGNAEAMRTGTSVARRARLAELLERHRGRLDPERAALVLRDTDGAGEMRLALGHRSAINAMIATHAVVADVSAGILWVSRGPHQLGAFDAYSIASFPEPAAAPIADDPRLADGSFERVTRARALLAHLAREGDRVDPDTARARLEEVLALVPGDPIALERLGALHAAAGRAGAARAAYRAALAGAPAYEAERARIEAALVALEAREPEPSAAIGGAPRAQASPASRLDAGDPSR